MEAREQLAVRAEQVDLCVRALDGAVREEEHPIALRAVLELDAVAETQPHARDVRARGVHLAAAAEAVAAPASAEVHRRRRRPGVAGAGGTGYAPRDPRLTEVVGADKHRHRHEPVANVLGLERDDEEAAAEDLALFEEVDGAKV